MDLVLHRNLVLKNYILNKEITIKYINYLLNIKLSKLKNLTSVYFNTKNSDGNKYINNKKKNTLFIAGCRFNIPIKENKNMYFFVTTNSWNPQLSYTQKINESQFQSIHKYIPFNTEYIINEEGYIYIFLNNSLGWFQNSLVEKYKPNIYLELLETLIIKIKKYTNRKIKIRLHKKDRKTQFENNIINFIKSKDNIEYCNEDISVVFKNIYCAFIQNSKLIIDLVNLGIPIFNLGFIKCNYFPEIQIPKLEYINNLEVQNLELLPNRKDFLMKYYFHLNFDLLDKPQNFINLLDKFKLLS
tara:strand:- start:14284 stop:15183 length:900 start_codon:yes stop_codon:yes gene_type:complete